MSKFADLIERVKNWSPQRQEDVAHVIEAMEQGGTDVYTLSRAERHAVAIGMAQAKRGEFVSDQDLEKFRNRRPSGAEQSSHDGNRRA
jgi:predicted transcriptional regulator